MRLLDLFCGAGGAAMGYSQAGFDEIVGVDIERQPNYPFSILQEDALGPLVRAMIRGGSFDLIHASPPCQAYSNTQRIQGNGHPDLIGSTREMLQIYGFPYVIENVPGAPLIEPIELCGQSFELGTYRHRLFECSFPVEQPVHIGHNTPTTKMGRPPKADEMMHVVGNFSGVEQARAAMGIDWMNRDELSEAIPPAYTRFIGEQFLAQVAV